VLPPSQHLALARAGHIRPHVALSRFYSQKRIEVTVTCVTLQASSFKIETPNMPSSPGPCTTLAAQRPGNIFSCHLKPKYCTSGSGDMPGQNGRQTRTVATTAPPPASAVELQDSGAPGEEAEPNKSRACTGAISAYASCRLVRPALYTPLTLRDCTLGNVSGGAFFSLRNRHVDTYPPPRAIIPGHDFLRFHI
jgi:hypothetical protein